MIQFPSNLIREKMDNIVGSLTLVDSSVTAIFGAYKSMIWSGFPNTGKSRLNMHYMNNPCDDETCRTN